MKKRFLCCIMILVMPVMSCCTQNKTTIMPDVSVMQIGTDELKEIKLQSEAQASMIVEIPLLTVDDMGPAVMYALSDINIMSEPDEQSDIAGFLSENESIVVNGISNNGWYRVECNDDEGYVADSSLSSEPVTGNAIGFAEPHGNINTKWPICADERLAMLPKNALQRFKAEGQHFYVTDEDINITEFNGIMGRTAGATRYGEYIKVEDRQYAMDEAVLHEFGHFVFDICGNWTRKDVVDAFNTDVKNASLMGITYGTDNVCEFYAEVFQKYILDRKDTADIFPNLADIIEKDLDSL